MSGARKSAVAPASTPGLFGPGEMAFKPISRARLVAMAKMAKRARAKSDKRREEDLKMILRLRAWGADLGRRFGLHYASLDPERDGVNGHFGICYEDGVIRIRLRHATTGRLLKESSLVDTLCHELAHLRYLDHSLQFRRLYEKILAAARRLGYYRPGPRKAAGPIQLSLFSGEG
jgi:hypothetical protein